ncbi:MAG TPA: hypothetical protein VE621_08405 [Bryobacteraceae bacterium]|nr:hypothetical protein [Bryobacteraceae bacterium]
MIGHQSVTIHQPKTRWSIGRPRTLARLALIALVLVVGIAIRARHLDTRPLWVDEAESSINALTILEHGVPTDSYLGLPIYENTHVWFWPESEEYEFRDVSYSDKHLAVYHGWLPLYSIAASFALHGIKPDMRDASVSSKHDLTKQKRRTRAARLPSVVFAALFLIVVFIGGRVMYGRDAGWVALVVGSTFPTQHLEISNQARYYSAQMALTTACCVSLWMVIKSGRWRDILFMAACYVLLFHSHLLGFVGAATMLALSTPIVIRRHPDWFRKLTVFGILLLVGTVPWIIGTGFYRHQSRIPRAWPLLQFPRDLFRYPPFNPRYAGFGILAALVVLCVWLFVKPDSRRFVEPLKRLGPVMLFTLAWAAVGYTTFLFFIPAASFTQSRMNFSYWGPCFILFAAWATALARILTASKLGRMTVVTAMVLMVSTFFAVRLASVSFRVTAADKNSRKVFTYDHIPGTGRWDFYQAIFEKINSMNLDADARIYSAPNTHLVMTFYSGLPIQDITPVRKSFLDSYSGDIVYVDPDMVMYTGILDPEIIQEIALANGHSISAEQARETSILLYTRDYRKEILEALAPDQPTELEPVPTFLLPLLETHRVKVAEIFAHGGYDLVTRGHQIKNWSDWLAVLKYRFVNPDARRGAQANFVQRIRNSDAMILTRGGHAALFRSPWHPPLQTSRINFRILQ